ncbi:MAG: hypothetical protein ACJAZ8_000610 [Planctomycetota bacterium]|jgi:hypothetical protein
MKADSKHSSNSTGGNHRLGEPKSLGKGPTIYFLVTFLVAACCFAWLAYTNADAPRTETGGRQITYSPPFYCLLAVVGQLFLALPFLIRRAARLNQ